MGRVLVNTHGWSIGSETISVDIMSTVVPEATWSGWALNNLIVVDIKSIHLNEAIGKAITLGLWKVAVNLHAVEPA